MRLSHRPAVDIHNAAPAIEMLEGRRLLSGTVTANFDASGTLVVKGDNQPNGIYVFRSGTDYTVYSIDDTVIATNAPGATPAAVSPSFTSGWTIPAPGGVGAKIELAGGNDKLFVAGAYQGQNLSVDTGSGDDQLVVYDSVQLSAGTFTFNMGSGIDRLFFSAQTSAATLVIDTGNNADSLDVDGTYTAASATINAGNGDDRINIGGSATAAAVTFSAGNGNDTVRVIGPFAATAATITIDGSNGLDSLTGKDLITLVAATSSIVKFESVA
jgi:hypothetical protein